MEWKERNFLSNVVMKIPLLHITNDYQTQKKFFFVDIIKNTLIIKMTTH